jgi:lipid A 3-O-deacylase
MLQTLFVPLLLAVPPVVAEPDLQALAGAPYSYAPADASPSNLGAMQDGTPHRFGIAGDTYWILNLAGGSDFSRDHLARVGGGISHFMADDISIDLDLNLINFWQEGEDAIGGNLNLLLRWHFLHDEARSWSVYADGGAGLLWTHESVPHNGSRFNFTPQFGLGASFAVCDDKRLFVGGRWFHVSNARLYDNNPGRDFGLFYVMLGWPF